MLQIFTARGNNAFTHAFFILHGAYEEKMHVLTCVSLQGLAIRPKESEIIVIMEDIYEQIL